MTEKTDITVPDKDDEVPMCGNCFFSERQELNPIIMDPQGELPLVCRRFPPTIVQIATAMGQPAIGAAPAPVQASGWCGEHEPTHAPLIEH